MIEHTIQPWAIAELPLHKLLALGRSQNLEASPEIRIAILGTAATQHYNKALSATLRLRGFRPDVYEAEFDMIEHEVRNAQSELYAHSPDFVVLFTSTQPLWDAFEKSRNKSTFGDEVFASLRATWTQIRSQTPATIIQHNFVVPLNRPFGNGTSSAQMSFAGAIARLNALLATLPTGTGVTVVDTEFLASYYGKRQWLDERLWCQARQAMSPAYLPPLTKVVSDAILLERGVAVKCVVVDLDNTIWGGVLADDGIDRIEIGQTELGLAFHRFQMMLAELRDRGVLLAACSKNNQENVLKVLDDHPDMRLRRSDFAIVVANYGDKVSNIRHIQKSLNISFDSMVFFDDTAFERNLVRSALPMLQVPELPEDPASFIAHIAQWNLFEGRQATSEDLARTGYYQADAARAEIRDKYEGLDDFISDLRMEARIASFDTYTLPRALQLVQRSNQFNLTTIRYSEQQLEALAAAPDTCCMAIRLSDRLGDNGIVAVAIVRREGSDAVVDTWIMSCRVLGRKVEQLALEQIASVAAAWGCERIVGEYRPTAKNEMVSGLYPSLGFEDAGPSAEGKLFALKLANYVPTSIPITVASEPNFERQE